MPFIHSESGDNKLDTCVSCTDDLHRFYICRMHKTGSSNIKIKQTTKLRFIFNSNINVIVDFFLQRKVSNNPDPSLHKSCKLFASRRIIEFILGGPPSIIYPLCDGSVTRYAEKL